MTEKQRQEAEAWATNYFGEFEKLKNDYEKLAYRDCVRAYIAGCQAKRGNLHLIAKDWQEKYGAECARSAKLLAFVKWIEMRTHGTSISEDAAIVVDEYQASR